MSETGILLKNAHIINEGQTYRGDLMISRGKIRQIFRDGHGGRIHEDQVRVMDLSGLWVLPGVIDDQVHFREPGLTHKADLFSESRAAVAGGITSFMEMPNTDPQTVTQQRLEDKFKRASEKSIANYSFYIGATNNNPDELKATDPNHVCGIKVFMGSSTGNMLVDDETALSNIFRESRLPVAVHCEDEATVLRNLQNARAQYGDNIPAFMHAAIRNHEACEKSSRMAVSLAQKFGTRLHLLHLSTANELRFLENNTPLKDKRITAEVCVHHLWFSMDDYAARGSLIKWNPAVKFESDRQALINGILDGYLDVVATDHAPHTLEEKQKPYLLCPSGGPMVQHSLPAMLTLAAQHDIPVEKVVSLMCHNPAICFNIKNRGFIREGYAADIVVVDPASKTMIDREKLLYKCGWSPLEGVSLDYRVIYTFVNGNIVYEKGEIKEGTSGEALVFER
ncbi:MAG: dihydroorotase [Bacteroidales bacterium]|nr:dihydroorotase [Bacteroidales bacterium]